MPVYLENFMQGMDTYVHNIIIGINQFVPPEFYSQLNLLQASNDLFRSQYAFTQSPTEKEC
jgi:hypothetical protein